jgi:hypothetical protein
VRDAVALVACTALALVVVGTTASSVPVAAAAAVVDGTAPFDVDPAVQCGFVDGDSDPAIETVHHRFGEVVVGRTGTLTVPTLGPAPVDGGSAAPTEAGVRVDLGGPDAGQFRAVLDSSDRSTAPSAIRLSFAPTSPGSKRAWGVERDGERTTVHCLAGTGLVAAASRGGEDADAGDGARGGAGGSSDSDVGDGPGSGGGKLTDAARGFGREFVGSVTRGVVSVVTLEFARDAAVGAGLAWAAGDGLLGKTLGVAGYALSGIDPTAGLRKGVPAALAAWRAGDFEGAGRALFGVVESVIFTGAAAAGAWEGSKRARRVARDRRRGGNDRREAALDGSVAARTAAYRVFAADVDRTLASGLEHDFPARSPAETHGSDADGIESAGATAEAGDDDPAPEGEARGGTDDGSDSTGRREFA